MTVSVEINKNIYLANGVQNSFQYTFKIYKSSHLQVWIKTDSYNTLQLEGTNYTVTGVGNETGGNVIFEASSIPPLTSKVILYGNYDYKQETDYVENDSFPADSHENVVDKLTYLHIKVNEQLSRCLKMAVDADITDLVFPDPSAGKLIGWDSDAENLINYTNPAVDARYWAELSQQYSVEGSAYVGSSASNAANAASSATTVSGYLMDIDTAISNSTATAGQLALTNSITISGTWGSSDFQLRTLLDERYDEEGISIYPSGDVEDNILLYTYPMNYIITGFNLHTGNDAAMVFFATREAISRDTYSDWTYYATASGNALDIDYKLTEHTTISGATTNYLQTVEGKNYILFPDNVVAAQVKMYVVPSGSYNAVFYQACPNRFVGAEIGAFRNLSAMNANVGDLHNGRFYSQNWGTTAGSFIDMNGSAMYLGGSSDPDFSYDGSSLTIRGDVHILNPSDVRTDINVSDNATTTFRQDAEPATGMREGDTWFDTNDGNKMYYYDGDNWVLVRDTDIDAALGNAASAQSTADGKIVSFYETEMPASGTIGDLWFDTNDGNKLYRHNGSTFITTQDAGIANAITAAQEAQDTADGKIITFYSTSQPTASGVGDLWYNPDTAYLKRWDGDSWETSSTNNASWEHPSDPETFDGGVINQGSVLTIAEGGSIIVGNDNIQIRTVSGTNDIIVTGDGGITYNDYVHLNEGGLDFYYNTASGTHTLYKSVIRQESGTAENGDWVTISGIWKAPPYIKIAPKNMPTYDPSYDTQAQSLTFNYSNLQETTEGNMEYKFKVLCQLELAAGVGGSAIGQYGSPSTTASRYTSFGSPTSGQYAIAEANTRRVYATVACKGYGWSQYSVKTGIGEEATYTYYRRYYADAYYARLDYYAGGSWHNGTGIYIVQPNTGYYSINIDTGTSASDITYIRAYVIWSGYTNTILGSSLGTGDGGIGQCGLVSYSSDQTATTVLADGTVNWWADGR